MPVRIRPTLLSGASFGYDPALVPYAFDPGKARHLLREAGYPNGLPLSLISAEDLEVQATVVSKMLEQAGFRVALQLLDADTFNRQTHFAALEQPPEHQPWDIALLNLKDYPPVVGRVHCFAPEKKEMQYHSLPQPITSNRLTCGNCSSPRPICAIAA